MAVSCVINSSRRLLHNKLKLDENIGVQTDHLPGRGGVVCYFDILYIVSPIPLAGLFSVPSGLKLPHARNNAYDL